MFTEFAVSWAQAVFVSSNRSLQPCEVISCSLSEETSDEHG